MSFKTTTNLNNVVLGGKILRRVAKRSEAARPKNELLFTFVGVGNGGGVVDATGRVLLKLHPKVEHVFISAGKPSTFEPICHVCTFPPAQKVHLNGNVRSASH